MLPDVRVGAWATAAHRSAELGLTGRITAGAYRPARIRGREDESVLVIYSPGELGRVEGHAETVREMKLGAYLELHERLVGAVELLWVHDPNRAELGFGELGTLPARPMDTAAVNVIVRGRI